LVLFLSLSALSYEVKSDSEMEIKWLSEGFGRVPMYHAVLKECKRTKNKNNNNNNKKHSQERIPGLSRPMYFSCKGISSGPTVSCGNPVTSKSHTAHVFCLSTHDRLTLFVCQV